MENNGTQPVASAAALAENALPTMKKNSRRKRVVIVGMGFGGLEAARALSKTGLDVVVLDRRNFHLFQPLLYQVATAMLDQETVAHSIRAITRNWRNTRFRMAEVQNVDFQNKRVLASDVAVEYDYLVLAAGSVTNFFGNEEIQRNAFDLKQLHDAVSLRNHILSAYESAAKTRDPVEREALMSFVIVGGGPTGVEFAGALSELTQHVLSKDYPELPVKRSRVILIESGGELLSPFEPKLRDYALKRLRKMGVEVRLNTRVSGVEAQRVLIKDSEPIQARTLFWAAGVRAAPLVEAIQVEKAKGGRVPVAPDLSLPDHPGVFVIGDLAYLEQDGQPLPMLAPVAMQGGEFVGKTIAQREGKRRGKEPLPDAFHYFDKGTMAVIGRYSAVAEVPRELAGREIKIRGFLAWLAWLGLHLYYLVGFRNRLAAIVNWGYSYVLYDQQVRLITRETKSTGDDAVPVALGAVPAGAHALTDPEKSMNVQGNINPRGNAQ